MPNIAKHVFKYQEYRRTLFLNLASKDDFGRHRGQVLYGMTLRPAGTSVIIGPGAVYTAYGTKFYWDVVNAEDPSVNTLDISNVQVPGSGDTIFAAVNQDKRPLTVAIMARVVPQDPARQPEVEGEVDLTANSIEFVAEIVAHSRTDSHPTLYMPPLNPVEMDEPQLDVQALGDFINTTNSERYGTSHVKYVNSPTLESVGLNDIVLGYLIIGSDSNGSPATTVEGVGGTWQEGVAYIPCSNAWESLTDFLGFDVLLGRTDRQTVGQPATGDAAYTQIPTNYETGGGRTTSYLTPKFGTPEVFSPSNPWAGTWNTYRPASFLQDGEQLIWVLRRLDYMMRLWMDRTGDQELIAWIQDGTATGLDPQAPLHQILAQFTGLDNSDNNNRNLNAIVWPDGVPAANAPALNHTLKSGIAGHLDRGMDTLDKPYGDSHAAAISALDWAFWNILTNLFGIGRGGRSGIDRAWMRSETTWDRNSLPTILDHYFDGPRGSLPNDDAVVGPREDVNRPVLTGFASTAYLSNEPIYDGLSLVAQRAHQAGQNMLRNNSFSFGDNASEADGDPMGWALTNTSAWARTAVLPTLHVLGGDFSLTASGLVEQEVAFTGDHLASASVFSAAMHFRVTVGTCRFGVRAYDGTNQLVASAMSQDFTSDGWVSHSFIFRLATSTIRKLVFVIEPVGGAAEIGVASAWMGQGSTPANPSFSATQKDYMSPDAGRQSKWREDQILDNNDVHFGTDYGDPVWNDHERTSILAGVTQSYSGELSDPRVEDSATLRTLVTALLDRSRTGSGTNLLRNPNFFHPNTTADSGDETVPPLGYSLSVADWTITKENNRSYLRLDNLFPGGYLEQDVRPLAGYRMGSSLINDRVVAAHAVLSCPVAADITLEIITFDEFDVENGRATATFAIGDFRQAVSITALVPDDRGNRIATFRWRITNAGAADVDGLQVHDAWLGYGWPPDNADDARDIDYVNTTSTNPLLRDFDLWNKKAVNMADPANPQDGVNKRIFDAAIAAEALARTNADASLSGRTSAIEAVIPNMVTGRDAVLADDPGADSAPATGWTEIPPDGWYRADGGTKVGNPVRFVLGGGLVRYVPAYLNPRGPGQFTCHSNCHSNCCNSKVCM